MHPFVASEDRTPGRYPRCQATKTSIYAEVARHIKRPRLKTIHQIKVKPPGSSQMRKRGQWQMCRRACVRTAGRLIKTSFLLRYRAAIVWYAGRRRHATRAMVGCEHGDRKKNNAQVRG